MTRFLNAGNIRLLVAVGIALLAPLSARGATPPGAAGPPSRIREPTPPPQQVKDYFTVAKQDAERARQYLKAAEAALTSYGARIDQLNAQADQLVNKPIAQFLRDYPKMRSAESNIGRGLGWSIGEKEKAFWVEEMTSAGVRKALKRMDDALGAATAYVKPTVYFDGRAAAQGEKTQLRYIDEVERSLAEGIKVAFDNRLSLRQQQNRWDMALLDAQATLRTLKGWARWGDLVEPISKDLNAARKALDDSVPFGHAAERNQLYEQREPKLFADAMARLAPLCSDASKQDALYVVETGGRIQALVDRFKGDHRRIVDAFRAVVTDLYKDKSGVKAELGAAALLELRDIGTVKSFGPPGEGLADLGVQIDWQVWTIVGQHVNSLGDPASVADERTRLNTPSCLSWNDQMPKDLEARFPALTAELQDHRAFFTVNLDKPQKAPAPVVGGEKVAQGGRWPQDGP